MVHAVFSRGFAAAAAVGALLAVAPLFAQQTAQPTQEHGQPPFAQTAPTSPVLEIELNPQSQLVSAWLSNGIRLHYRRMPEPAASAQTATITTTIPPSGDLTGTVSSQSLLATTTAPKVAIAVTLAGSELHETEASMGLSYLCIAAWQTPATRSLPSEELARRLDAIPGLKLDSYAGPDTLMLKVESDPAAFPQAIELVRDLLSEPIIEPAAFEQWRETALGHVRGFRKNPRGISLPTLVNLIYPPTEPRFRLVTDEELASARLDDAQAWLDRHIRGSVPEGGAGGGAAPMEIAIVGDISLDEALRIAAPVLAQLPARPRISPAVFAEKRRVQHPPLPLRGRAESKMLEGESVVMVGFYTTHEPDLAAHRALGLASRIFESRLSVRLAGQDISGASTKAWSAPGASQPGTGMLLSLSTVPREHAETLATLAEAELDALAREPATDDELAAARKAQLAMLDSVRDPAGWASVYATSTFRGYQPRVIDSLEHDLRTLTAVDVHVAMARFHTPGRFLRVIVDPAEK
ncbi:MAG: insulinase family protein [Phycisphaerales bacterium]|nr:insulinase family protein [Phycisphaerales bacterium]